MSNMTELIKTVMATREEVDQLKADWLADPIWDIADIDTEEFEPYFQELKQFQADQEKEWKEAKENRIKDRCFKLGCTPALLAYIESLEYHLSSLEKEVERLWERT